MTDQEICMHIRSLNSALHNSRDAEYETLSRRYLQALAEVGVHFQSPGPGSPARWIVHGIEYKIAPHISRPAEYRFERIGEQADAALGALAALFSQRLPAFAAKCEREAQRRAFCFGWHLRPKNGLLRSFDRDALFVTDQDGNPIGALRARLSWPEGKFESVTDSMYALLASQGSSLSLFVGAAGPNWVIAIEKPLKESPLAAFEFAPQDDGVWLLDGQPRVFVLHAPRVGADAKHGALVAQRYWKERLARRGVR